MKTKKKIYQENNQAISSISDPFTLHISDPEQYYKINHYFDLFLHGAVNPLGSDVVRDIVAESWIRSQNYGLSPEDPVKIKKIPSSDYKRILNDNRLLIETSAPILDQSLAFLKHNKYFVIYDHRGILLNTNNTYELGEPGTDFSEQSVGTTSHSLCLQYGIPVYLISVEHYTSSLRQVDAISVPIHDPEDKVIAALSIAARHDISPFENNKTYMQCLIALQFIIAKKIEDNLRFVRLNHQFRFDKNPLGAGMSINSAQKNTLKTPLMSTIDNIPGESPEMLKAKKITRKIACNLNHVLLIGESGTGKELFAQAIHYESRPDGPFVAINCSSIPRNLIESELFGYEKGSFTGAERSGRMGKLELANNGTLFLDEIGDMPLEVQPVLLRVLEDRLVTRVGGNHPIPVNIRVIAATNKDLFDSVKNKEFREDLYFRLAVLKILIPPLRDRENDILKLAKQFVRNECQSLGIPYLKMNSPVTALISQYNWPGNVRQLKNAISYAVSMAEDGVIKLSDLPEEITNDLYLGNMNSKPRPMSDIEKEAIRSAMLYTKNNIRHAAEVLDIGRSTLYRRLKEFGMDCDYDN